MGVAQVVLARDGKCIEKRREMDMLVLEALHMDRESGLIAAIYPWDLIEA